MNRGRQQRLSIGGYTIVETLIFLAISSLIFVTAVMLISGRQARAQFQSSVRGFETQLADIANDVATGYYEGSTGSTGCNAAGGTPNFSGTNPGLGKNSDCIFIGTVIKLGDAGNNERFTQLTMAGLRQSGGDNVTSLASATPRVLDNSGGVFDTKDLGGGLRVACIGVGTDGCANGSTDNAAIGFFTTFEGATLSDAGGGAVQADVVNYGPTVATNQPLSGATGAVARINAFNYATATFNRQITICLLGSSNQYALVRLGGNSSSSLTITSDIREGSSCS